MAKTATSYVAPARKNPRPPKRPKGLPNSVRATSVSKTEDPPSVLIAPSPPNIRANPQIHHPRVPAAYTMNTMETVWATFLARVKPAATRANPAAMNMTRYPVLRVHVILMPTRLWPTASATSSGVGFPASFAGMSATVPVAVPLGSGFGSGLGSSALTRLTSSTSNRTKEQSFTVRRMGDLLSLAIHRGPSTEGMLGVPRPDITLRGARALV